MGIPVDFFTQKNVFIKNQNYYINKALSELNIRFLGSYNHNELITYYLDASNRERVLEKHKNQRIEFKLTANEQGIYSIIIEIKDSMNPYLDNSSFLPYLIEPQ